MQLKPVDVVPNIDRDLFRKNYFEPRLPVVIKDLAKQWPAYHNGTGII
jgi:hypothetical protein